MRFLLRLCGLVVALVPALVHPAVLEILGNFASRFTWKSTRSPKHSGEP